MRREKVTTDYSAMRDDELSTLGGRVKQAMGDSTMLANFPDADVVGFVHAVDDFTARHELSSRGGSSREVSEKNESRAILVDALRKLGGYVNSVARGRSSMLLSTGLVLIGPPRPMTLPAVPEKIRLRDGAVSGQVRLDFSAVQSAWEYEVEVGKAADTEGVILWEESFWTTSSRGSMLTGLAPGDRCYARVRARNGRGLGDWSQPVSLIVR